LTNQYGCDSVVTTITRLLPSDSITINATTCNAQNAGTTVQTLTNQYGCDSVVTTITTLLPSDSITINATTCVAQNAGTTVQTLTNQYGCDSVVTTITRLLPSDSITINATTCNAQNAGTTVQTLTNQFGCDSVVTTITMLLPSDSITINATTCVAQNAGTTVQTLTNQYGCDSVVTTITTLLPSDSITINATTCDTQAAGTMVETLTNQYGCDSIVTTITTLLPSDSITINATTCIAQNAGITIQTLTNQYGCDSVVTTITTLLPSSSTTVNATTCDSTQAGTTVAILIGANGCDSVITTITTLLPSSNFDTLVRIFTCKPDSVIIGGQTFTQLGHYIIVLTNTVGCDSTITLDIVERVCNDPEISTVDTLRDTNVIDTTTIVCIPISISMHSDSLQIIDCGYANNSGNIYTASGDSCIQIIRSTTVGYNLDTLCVVLCDTISNVCDTVTVIISNTPKCRDVIADTSVTVSCNGNGTGDYCLPLDLATIQQYNIYIDGTRSALQFNSPSGCGTATVDAGYGFQTTNYIDNVAHLLEVWNIDSTRKVSPNINFQNLGELAVYMNSVDTAGHWYVDGLNVRPANTSSLYSTGSGIQYFALAPQAKTYYVPYSYNIGYSGTKISLASGCHMVRIVDTITGCEDSIRVCVSSCTPIDTIVDTIPVRDTITICPFIDLDSNDVVTACDGSTVGQGTLGTWVINSIGCLEYIAGSTIGNDTLCTVRCDQVTNTCDTVIIIITVIPVIDIKRDTNFINTDTLICVDIEPGLIPVSTTIVGGCGAIHSNNTYTVSGQDGCILIERGDSVGYNLDTICIVVCNAEGVCDTTKVIISNIKKPEACQLPTVITPNGDGFNETFIIPCPSSSAIQFSVYNRWGIEVYRSEDYHNNFDGRYQGSELPDGTYYYIVKYVNTAGDEINKASYLTIHR